MCAGALHSFRACVQGPRAQCGDWIISKVVLCCRWGELMFPQPFGRTMSQAEQTVHEADEKTGVPACPALSVPRAFVCYPISLLLACSQVPDVGQSTKTEHAT